ncbi:ATP-dependent DNA helicase PIF1-like [Sycon ciliatum]|uniref:ATP-dependent DNA helicase PIF1-like n=1 Tax=Sycon ciliatum TaxID=27933 RepID=UPI0031F67FF2
MEVTEVECTLNKEFLLPNGEVGRREAHKSAKLSLCRASSSAIVLRISQPDNKETAYRLKIGQVQLHKRFLKEGRSTIVLAEPKARLFLSNCPPGHLSSFLRTMMIKLTGSQVSTPQAAAAAGQPRRVPLAPSSLENISPLTEVDVDRAEKVLASKQSTTPQRVPSRSVFAKRKPLSPVGKENPKQPCLRTGSSHSVPGTSIGGGKGAQRSLIQRTMSLTKQQQQVLQLVRSGKSIFLTGGAGTGKSFLLRRIISTLPPESTFVTASTGVAACHIGGVTLHSFAGIGTVPGTPEENVARASRDVPAGKWRRCSYLIIDEVSMVDGEFFDHLEYVARAVRGSKKPFGGIQLILTGDFFQLPPVTAASKKTQFCFDAKSWRRCIQVNVELKEVFRQSDPEFVAMLGEIRQGRCTASTTKRLQATSSQTIESNGVKATRLCTHRDAVSQINASQLEALTSKSCLFTSMDSPPEAASRLNQMCPTPSQLSLKVGAQVMLTKNICMSSGLVNGARGIVTSFDPASGLPTVQFMNGSRKVIGREKWVFGSTGNMLVRCQLPLQLAWAISIHKSQGMSLDCVEISLARVFECGQAYVALSRARSLDTLRVIDFDPSCIHAHSTVAEFYRRAQHELGRPIVQEAFD